MFSLLDSLLGAFLIGVILSSMWVTTIDPFNHISNFKPGAAEYSGWHGYRFTCTTPSIPRGILSLWKSLYVSRCRSLALFLTWNLYRLPYSRRSTISAQWSVLISAQGARLVALGASWPWIVYSPRYELWKHFGGWSSSMVSAILTFERSIYELSPPQDFGGAVILHSRVLTISLISWDGVQVQSIIGGASANIVYPRDWG